MNHYKARRKSEWKTLILAVQLTASNILAESNGERLSRHGHGRVWSVETEKDKGCGGGGLGPGSARRGAGY